jgi:hypothetical protein
VEAAVQSAARDAPGDRVPAQAGREQLLVGEEIVLAGRELGGGVSAAGP